MDINQSIQYLRKMADKNGIIQFSRGTQKDYSNGYAIEDQARGLIAAVLIQDSQLARSLLNIILAAQEPARGVKMLWNANGEYLSNLDDFGEASAECLWSLAFYLVKSKSSAHRKAEVVELIKHLTEGVVLSSFPRVAGYALIGTGLLQDKANSQILADKLMQGYSKHSKGRAWEWFEPKMTYANAVMPWGLLAAHQATGKQGYLQVGLKTLDFLLSNLHYQQKPIVVGNKGWWAKSQAMAIYDQQPIDVSYLILACIKAYEATGQRKYLSKAEFYFSWFGGNNLHNVSMIRGDGACHDGLNEDGINQNCGAESTVCYLIAAAELTKHQQKS